MANHLTSLPNQSVATTQGQMKTLPNEVEAEQALLGALLINNETFDKISDFLLPHHFFDPVHGRIFDVITKFIKRGNSVTPLTLKTYFERDEGLTQLGGTSYFAKLLNNTTSISNIAQYGKLIHDLAIRRELIKLGQDMTHHAYEADVNETPADQIENAEQALYRIAEKGQIETGFMEFGASMAAAVEMAELAHKRDGKLSGLATGFGDLDDALGGLQKSDLIVLASRPSMGKTSLATNIAFNIASNYTKALQEGNITEKETGEQIVNDGGVVGFFSLEMSAEQLAMRILAEQTEISSNKIRKGNITEDEYGVLFNTANQLQTIPLFIDHTGAISIATLATRARRLKRQHGLGCIVVDYLQLMSAGGNAKDNRTQEVSVITQGLKSLAKELNVPVIAISQLSRQVEARDNKRPLLSDLRESGSIEQDADIVMFIYREIYYLEKQEPEHGTDKHLEWQTKCNDLKNKAELIISKNRHGPVKKIDLYFDGEKTKFRDMAKVDYETYYNPSDESDLPDIV